MKNLNDNERLKMVVRLALMDPFFLALNRVAAVEKNRGKTGWQNQIASVRNAARES